LKDEGVWEELQTSSPLGPGQQHFLPAQKVGQVWTHLRFKIFPDGGVARLRAYGAVTPPWKDVFPGELIDLAAIEWGGVVVGCSDMYFGNKNNIIMPGRSVDMGDGWETKRRRGPGYDWLVIRLGAPGVVKRIEVDTNWFKGNFPESFSIEITNSPSIELPPPDARWHEILPNTPLRGHERHFFATACPEIATHVRLNIFPDGGVSRLRVHCLPGAKL